MAYRASKAALNMMAACYAEEQAQDGVKVLAVHPGESHLAYYTIEYPGVVYKGTKVSYILKNFTYTNLL